MKRIAIFLSACSILAACSKETQTMNHSSKIKKSGDYSEIEYYTNPSDVSGTLSTFLTSVTGSGDQTDRNLDEGIWLLEGSINYKYRHADGLYDSYSYADPIVLTISVITSGTKMSGSSLQSAWSTIDEEILEIIGDEVAFHVVDISVDSLWSTGITLRAQPVYGLGTLTSIANISNDAQADRQQGKAVQCDGVTVKPNTGYQYAARLATGKFTVNQSACAGYRYAVNVQNYQSYGGVNTISPDNLFGQVSSPISTQRNFAADYSCVSMSDIEDYRDQIYTDISAVKASSQSFISVQLDLDHLLCICNASAWIYDKVSVGEIKCTTLVPSF